MKPIIAVLSAAFILFVSVSSDVHAAEIEWQTMHNFTTETHPLDMAMASKNFNMFILSEGGAIQVYEPDGSLKGTMKVAATVSGIEVSPDGNTIFLRDREKKTVRVVSVDYVVDINDDGSPSLGPVNAPVQIAVYSDFQ